MCDGLEDAAVLLELAEGGEEEAEELQLEVEQVGESLRKLELQSLLGEEFDGNNGISPYMPVLAAPRVVIGRICCNACTFDMLKKRVGRPGAR